MKKNEIVTREISEIWRSNKNRRRRCIVESCTEAAINSHILQKNGILDLICEERHFIITELIDFYKIKSPNDSLVHFRKIGINEGLSFPLFCKDHDVKFFNEIETGDYDPNSYLTQILFTYRSICKELRKKEIQIDIQGGILNNPAIRAEYTREQLDVITQLLRGFIAGVRDLKFYKNEIEIELNLSECAKQEGKKFTFVTLISDKLDVCTSSTFSPLDLQSHPLQDDPLNAIFISIFPKKENTVVICGFHNSFFNEWMDEFTHSWLKISPIEIQKRISEILILRCETWGISPGLFNKMSNQKKEAILRDITINIFSMDQDLTTEINIFDN